jgi:formylglycine-generating enzyme required for sulfatase activity
MAKLRSLSLENTKITDAGLKHLEALSDARSPGSSSASAKNQPAPVEKPDVPPAATTTPAGKQTKNKQSSPSTGVARTDFTNSIGMRLKLIAAGTFMMGSPPSEPDRRGGETQHRVRISKPFYLGVYEVTQGQYEKLMGANPSYFKGDNNPVEQVTWKDAALFFRELSARPEEQAAGRVYRLPTEAEWEYACRAGTTTAYSFEDASRHYHRDNDTRKPWRIKTARCRPKDGKKKSAGGQFHICVLTNDFVWPNSASAGQPIVDFSAVPSFVPGASWASASPTRSSLKPPLDANRKTSDRRHDAISAAKKHS